MKCQLQLNKTQNIAFGASSKQVASIFKNTEPFSTLQRQYFNHLLTKEIIEGYNKRNFTKAQSTIFNAFKYAKKLINNDSGKKQAVSILTLIKLYTRKKSVLTENYIFGKLITSETNTILNSIKYEPVSKSIRKSQYL